jgi:Domain of unknown function (DUF4214)
VYHDLLGRLPDDGGKAAWLRALAAGSSRMSVAYGFAACPEHESIVVAADYQQVLGRTPDRNEIAGWLANFQTGTTNEQILAAFVASDEFYARQDSTIEGWLKGVYQAVLGRAPDREGFDHWDQYVRSTFT